MKIKFKLKVYLSQALKTENGGIFSPPRLHIGIFEVDILEIVDVTVQILFPLFSKVLLESEKDMHIYKQNYKGYVTLSESEIIYTPRYPLKQLQLIKESRRNRGKKFIIL